MELAQYERELPVEHALDTIVVGGGPFGLAAAIAASRLLVLCRIGGTAANFDQHHPCQLGRAFC